MEYAAAHEELLKTPDGTPHGDTIFPGGRTTTTPASGESSDAENVAPHGTGAGDAHPVSCIDCHDPESMRARVTRPGFVRAIAALATSDDPVPHLPSIERWRKGDRKEPYDPNALADRQEMRTFVCAQCHVEYYCGPKETLFYPWERGLKVEQIEATYDEHKFPDGTPFFDFAHGETGAPVYKAQHPEFELWSQGIHARSGVSCVDCHMPYQRRGAAKTTDHWVRSPMLMLDRACQTCHQVSEDDLRERVETMQSRTQVQMARAAAAMTDMLDAILEAKAAGATEEELAPIYDLQRKGMWRLDFVSSENSKGFHADQEAMRILGESIDYCRQAQADAVRLRAGAAPEVVRPDAPIRGVTPSDKAPAGPDDSVRRDPDERERRREEVDDGRSSVG
jgi:nitrite reductase (cytochrome c-552)